MSEKKQHVDIQRKLKLRQQLLEKAGKLTGGCYIPFIGEGDIASAIYRDMYICGADIESAMVETAKSRLPGAQIITADCDDFPYKGTDIVYSLADFDSYSYPYDSFRSFFKGAKIASQCVLFFTDGQRQAIIRSGNYRTPDGQAKKLKTLKTKREAYNFYFNKIVLPWFKKYIKPWTIVYITKYLRSASMCYWGAIIEKPKKDSRKNSGSNSHSAEKALSDNNKGGAKKPYKFDHIKKTKYLEHISNGHTRGYAATLVGVSRMTIHDHMKKDKGFADAISEAETDATAKVENALYEAAISGNTTAIQVFLYNRDPKRWSDKRNIQLAGEGGGPIKVDIDGKGKLLQILNRLSKRIAEDKQ